MVKVLLFSLFDKQQLVTVGAEPVCLCASHDANLFFVATKSGANNRPRRDAVRCVAESGVRDGWSGAPAL